MLDFTCVLCTDDFKILKNFNELSKFSMFFPEKRHRRQHPPPPPQRPYDLSRGQNRYVTLPLSSQAHNIMNIVVQPNALMSLDSLCY